MVLPLQKTLPSHRLRKMTIVEVKSIDNPPILDQNANPIPILLQSAHTYTQTKHTRTNAPIAGNKKHIT